MTEFKLSYTANEINEKLGKVDNLVATVNGVAPDENGNVQIEIPEGGNEVVISSSAIVDVLELPKEDINKNVIYRLKTAKFVVYDEEVDNGSVIYCVESLPTEGKVVSDFSLSYFIGYYNITDNNIYGYLDSILGSAFGIPAGWYPFAALAQVAGKNFNGIIADIEDNPDNGYFAVLLSYDYYIYQDGWCKVPIAYEKQPKFDIQWDGVIGDRFALDISSLGFPNSFFVKMTDRVFANEELIGCSYTQSEGYEHTINEYSFEDMFPGMTSVDGGIVTVFDAELLNTSLGFPSGYMTNGTYFALITDGNNGIENYTNRLVAPTKVVKIDEKFLPDMSIDVSSLGLHSVARSGNYNDLYNRPNLSNYVTSSQLSNYVTSSQLSNYVTSSQVQNMINQAIGSAIGGNY